MENEIMNAVEETINPETMVNAGVENHGGAGFWIVVGGVATAAGIALYKFGRKKIQDHKAKKAAVEIKDEVDIADDKIDEIPEVK